MKSENDTPINTDGQPIKFPPNITEDELRRDRETGLTPVSLDEIRRQIDVLGRALEKMDGLRGKLDPNPNPHKFGLEADAPAPKDNPGPHQVVTIKCLRRDLDAQIQILKALPPSRERSIAITKLQESVMWLGMDLKRIADENPGLLPNPYPNSKDPSNVTIDRTADGLKL